MLGGVFSYFFPALMQDGQWVISEQLLCARVRLYLIRNGVPLVLFWVLQIYFLISDNLLLFVVCLALCLPFALSFGRILREYRDIRGNCP